MLSTTENKLYYLSVIILQPKKLFLLCLMSQKVRKKKNINKETCDSAESVICKVKRGLFCFSVCRLSLLFLLTSHIYSFFSYIKVKFSFIFYFFWRMQEEEKHSSEIILKGDKRNFVSFVNALIGKYLI